MKTSLFVLGALVLASQVGSAKGKAAPKVERDPAAVVKNRTGCPDGAIYFSQKDKWLDQISATMNAARSCEEARKLAEKCGASTPILLASATASAANRCAKDFQKNAELVKGYQALVDKCEEINALGGGKLAKWHYGQCLLNASTFYSDYQGAMTDLSER